jgi:NAD(P)-dependent dehydrogenase (short-subunit alcohol dehydrogenase family)
VTAPGLPSFRLDGRVALVTGASAGLGDRFARVLDAAGARVVLTARRKDRLEELAADLHDPVFLAGDLADSGHRAALVDLARTECGGLDILVNNAATNDDSPLERQTLDDLQRVVDLNLMAVMDLCRLAGPMLIESEHGVVVNVSSMYGVIASRGPMTAYNATKAALVGLSRHLAAQWGRYGVRVNALAPGYFPSEMTDDFADPDFRQVVEERTLLRRVPGIEELDGALLFLASDASSYVTGHTLVVDAGWSVV